MNVNEEKDIRPIMVSIRCTAYNHEKYIRDALEGFVMQKTNFRFEAIVHDDASTDGTAAIIREYAEKYPDIIKPIYETENQYSKHDGSLRRIMDEACKGKYIALCEGDDYWIEPYKLQKQVDFLESSPDYSMCWTDAFVEINGKKKAYNRYLQNCQSSIEDIIEKGGDFIPTCSILIRKSVIINMPSKAKGYFCGDYPLQMWSAYIGKTYYLSEQTCIYRFLTSGSWSYRFSKESKEQRLKHFENEKQLMEGFNALFEYKYNDNFKKREANVLYSLLISAGEYKMAKPYLRLRLKYGMHIDKADLCRIYGFSGLAKFVTLLSRLKRLILGHKYK